MAHFAKLNDDNIVTEVVVVNNEIIIKTDGTESEYKGKVFLNGLFGNANWVQTSYNGNFRKNYAGIGFIYDSERDAFIPPQPFNSWSLNEDTCLWDPPVSYPNDGESYIWNEDAQTWDLFNL